MKTPKKVFKVIIATILFSVLAISQCEKTYAVTQQKMGITELMGDNLPKMGYCIGLKGTDNSAIIWNIVKYNAGNSYEEANIYCVKAGVGFTDSEQAQIKKDATYDVCYDMKTKRSNIRGQNTTLEKLVDGNITEGSRYDALLALLDRLYLPRTEGAAEDKKALLEKVRTEAMTSKYSAEVEKMSQYPLTDNDISAVQQAAIWYFTNYEDPSKAFDKTNDSSWLTYTLDGQSYDSLENYSADRGSEEGKIRSYQAEILYNYLIKEAKANISQYANIDTMTGAPAVLNTTTIQRTTQDSRSIIGPINIEQKNARPYTINFVVNNAGAQTTDYKLLDDQKQEVAANKTVKDLVGNDFYISLPANQVKDLSITVTINYDERTMNLWASSQNGNEQPLVELDKVNKSVPQTLKLQDKPFDLALRKYITKKNGTPVENSRTPVENPTNIQTGASVAYNHRKDPLVVEEGDIITYEIAIYNEGLKSGRATRIVDQLPTGLKYSKMISQNFVVESYSETTDNTLNLVRNNNDKENLAPYSQGSLAKEIIQFECIVTAKPDKSNSKVLTNVAWISESYDAEADKYITNEVGADVDSEPSTKPNVNKDTMTDYRGDTQKNKEDLTDSNFYYRGEQDDDDFEKVVVLPEAFDLKLIKFITQVNNKDVVPDRLVDIDVSKLNTLDSTGKMIETAEYELNKEPVPVQLGDIVTYTFRVYNEGTIDGYAQKITENIPEGLKFLWSEKEGAELQQDTELTPEQKEAIDFNQTRLWGDFVYDQEGNIIQISTDYLSREKETATNKNQIEAFGRNEGNKTKQDLKYQEVSVKLQVVSNKTSGTTIRNEAEISEDGTIDPNNPQLGIQEAQDRDSDTSLWEKKNSDKFYDDDNKWPIYEEDDEDYDNVVLKAFDLATRKFIAAISKDDIINNDEYLTDENGLYLRAPKVDTSKLNTLDENGKVITTATYEHSKEPVEIQPNDRIVYMIRVYNEGDIDGYAGKITDHLPNSLEFVDSEFNRQYGWSVSADGRTVTTRFLENRVINKSRVNSSGNIVLSYEQVPIMCKVKEDAKTGESITNIAEIAEYLKEPEKPTDPKEPAIDRDSTGDSLTNDNSKPEDKDPNDNLPSDENLPKYKDPEIERGDKYIPGQQDDDDFEKVIIKPFDLALRKFITKIENEEVTSRIPKVKYDIDEDKITYEHSKDPVAVDTGDIVEYTIRVFNEGARNGYAEAVLDDIPEGLEYLPQNATNTQYRWKMYRELKQGENVGVLDKIEQDGKTYVETDNVSEADVIVTDYLSKEQGEKRMQNNNQLTTNPNLLKAFNKNEVITDTNPDHKDVKVAFKVVQPNTSDRTIINSAQISEDADENGNSVKDEDSEPGKWNEGEDDQDKEYLQLKTFDLALRKFITKVEDEEVTTRIPQVKYNSEEDKITYEHPKDPVSVVTGNTVEYTIRVFNEGEANGYASMVIDDIPAGLEFLPEDETNIEYRWVMFRELKEGENAGELEGLKITQDGKTYVETKVVSEAKILGTDYLSKEQGEERIKNNSELTENPNLLKAFNKNAEISETNPDHKDLKVAFDVVEPNTSDKVIINSAQISEHTDEHGDKVEDKDSTPGEWNDGEDDQDKENIELKYFDLSLKKWVTQAIVIDNGKQTVTQTGHQPYDNPEQVVKVEIKQNKLNTVTVKFRYSIRVTNEGDIEGYAKEVKDYVPSGLKFVASDNKNWKDEGNNVISTRQLENRLLKPGEYADVEVVLTWINGEKGLGTVLNNTAEISEDENEYGVPDKDSTPDNKKPGEDDIDEAPVILSIKTGQARIYYTIGFIVLISTAVGIIIIKKYVL